MKIRTHDGKGKLIKEDGTAKLPKEKPPLVDATAMSAAEFRKVVLELLGIKCK